MLLFTVILSCNLAEDQTSFSRHNNILMRESVKNRPNWTIVNDLMEKSFAMRRIDILDNACDVTEKYPFLKYPDQVFICYYLIVNIIFV